MHLRLSIRDALLLLALTAAALVLHGYHYGVEDQFVYLPAIEQLLDPALFPHDAEFFLLQTRWMLFDEAVALSIGVTHLPLGVAVFLWHVLSIFLLLLGSWELAQRCFADRVAQWAAVALVAVMLLLAVAGTLLFLADQYLHPRTLATAALLFAFVAVLDRKPRALAWFLVAGVLHPTMAAAGGLHLAFQAWKPPSPAEDSSRWNCGALALAPLLLLGRIANPAWHEILATRSFLYPQRWPWYAWLGVVAPLALLAWFARLAQRDGAALLEHVSRRLLFSGILGVVAGLAITTVPAFERLVPTEPMRTLHLVTLLAVLLSGGMLGRRVLKRQPMRWVLLFLPLCLVMFFAQRQLFAGSPHLEWPGAPARNAWCEAFEWARQNTPRDALFALDPRHQELPGQDFHSFRALAQRSMLADYSKDRAVAANFPQLAPAWLAQTRARENWRQFTLDDFRRLHREFGVTWVVISQPGLPGFDCPFRNDAVLVCRIP